MGEIFDDKINGEGMILDLNNNMVYVGGFKDNAFDGLGIL